MKHVTKYGEWQPVNENISLITLQIGVILGLFGWAALKRLIKEVAIKLGSNLEQEPAKLKKVVDDVFAEVSKKNDSGINIKGVAKDIKDKIDAGEIKTIAQITKYFDQA